ncbi:MAG TPA: arsinothricin resistance N-acetyltransferase ArsN1 family B [Sphingobium sp.]|nr:arsinothricin resistance N-acetyltransferase ArsN1 family B [Sphingobium sp.]
MTASIRIGVEEDAPCVAAIYAPYVLNSVISFESVPPDAEEFRRRIAACLPDYPWLIAEFDGQVVGYAYAGPHSARAAYDWSANISVYLAADHHKRGIGRRLYDILVTLLRHQGYHSLFAGITLPNSASVALHTALGMNEVGIYKEVGFKFGEWHDVMWMGMAISPASAPSAPPTPFSALRDLTHIVPDLSVGNHA